MELLNQNLPHGANIGGDISLMLELPENDRFFKKKKKLLEDMGSHAKHTSIHSSASPGEVESSLLLMLERARIINLDELELYFGGEDVKDMVGFNSPRNEMEALNSILTAIAKLDGEHCSTTTLEELRVAAVNLISGVSGGEGDLVAIDKGFSFELDELLRASAYVLGKSGLGIVYKVVLGNGIPVAVRRLGEGGEQRYKEFVAEIQAIGRVKHPNVVKLRAYYWAPDEKLLISDFISNGNLASALHGRNGQPSPSLTWSTRLKIAKGTARGLAYLHECSPRKFVHGDVKPSNILLDTELQPYISDFGLNRLINITGNNPSSSGGFMGGALPYLKPAQPERPNNYRAPEARITGNRPTQKWDVYSFGVVLLELLTGKSPDLSVPTTSTSTEVPDLVRWVRKGFEEQNPLSDMVEPMLLQEVHAKKEVLAVFHIALACTEADPDIRPRMKLSQKTSRKLELKLFGTLMSRRS